jgi:hypothetical protein
MAKQQLACAQIAGLLVEQRDFGSAQAVCPKSARFKVDHRDPLLHQPGILPRTDVLALPATTGEQPIIASPPTDRQPGGQCLSRRIRYLLRHRPPRFLLNYSGALA